MCDECRQYICDTSCPNSDYEYTFTCTECGVEFKKGESAYGKNDYELYCIDCLAKMCVEDIIYNFLEEFEI